MILKSFTILLGFGFLASLICYREIFSIWIRHILKARSLETTKGILLGSYLGKRPKVFLVDDLFHAESLSLRTFFKTEIYVVEKFWNELKDGEKELLMTWQYLSNQNRSLLRRFLGFATTHATDRACLVLGLSSVDLMALLEKAEVFRQQEALEKGPSLFDGLSYLGGSFYQERSNKTERLKKISLEASRLSDLKSL